MKKLYFLLILLISQTSCVINFIGVTIDFDKLSSSQKAKIKKTESLGELDRQFIYEINGQQLHEELKLHPKAIVYTFANGCSSDNCKPLNVYEDYADKHGYKLFCVMTTGYYQMDITLSQSFNNPVYAVDFEYYNETKTKKVQKYFKNEMMGKGKDTKLDKLMGGLFFFQYGVLEKNTESLPD